MTTTTVRALFATLALAAFGGCYYDVPFTGPGFLSGELRPEVREREEPYVVVIVHADLPTDNSLNPDLDDAFYAIRRSLWDEPQGFVGMGVRRSQPLSDEMWSMSIWETEEDAVRWAYADAAHIDAMQTITPRVVTYGSHLWTTPGHTLPPSWDEARARFREHGKQIENQPTGIMLSDYR